MRHSLLVWVGWMGLLLAGGVVYSSARWALEAGNNLLGILFSIVCTVVMVAWCIIGLLLMVDDE